MSKVKIKHFFHPELAKKLMRKKNTKSSHPFYAELTQSNADRKLCAKGSFTEPMVITKAILPDGRVGYALCSSSEPFWNRRLGNKIAIGRAKKKPLMQTIAGE